MARNKTKYTDLTEQIEVFGGSLDTTIFAKVFYHADFQANKRHINFIVRKRLDVLPNYSVSWQGNVYTVQYITQTERDYTQLECDIPAGLRPS